MRYVLFVCTHNAGRSQMAEAFFHRLAPEDISAESAGSQPAQSVWPEVVEAMREVDIDLAPRRPKKLTTEMQLHADRAVTMGCGDACPYVPTVVEDWDVPDPAGRPLSEVRRVRDEIEMRVGDIVEHRLEAIRSERTAHEFRLSRLLPSLIDEFSARRSPEEIRACADLILAGYEEAPIRSFAMTLAHRHARQCLGEEVCRPRIAAKA